METVVVPTRLNGLIEGATLFFVAVGLNLIFGVMGVLNVAHGSFYANGAFAAASAWALRYIQGVVTREGSNPAPGTTNVCWYAVKIVQRSG